MKRTKVENISGIKLDFFLQQNKQDVRIVLSSGETSWCDEGSTTKSMILYERKNLIKTSIEEIPEHEYLSIEEEKKNILERAKKALEDFVKIDVKNRPEGLIGNELVNVVPMTLPPDSLFTIESSKEDELKKEEPSKEEKKYKGKKRGRKKKRGPKKGSKRNKGNTGTDSESSAQE